MKRLSFLLLFACGASFAQGVSHTNIALYNSSGFARVVPSAVITVCTANDPQTPCTTKISIYSNYQLTSALANPFNADANGNYAFFAAPGNYTVTVTGIGITGFSYQISLGTGTPSNLTGPGAITGTFSGNYGTTGNNAHTGIETFVNINNVLYVGNLAGQFATLQAAHDALPSTGGTVFVMSTATPFGATALAATKPIHVIFDCANFTYSGAAAQAISTTSRGVIIEGCGRRGDDTGTAGTTITITNTAANGIANSGNGATFRDFNLIGPGSGTGKGVINTAGRATYSNLNISSFGSDGWTNDGSATNANTVLVSKVRSSVNGGNGFVTKGANGQLVTFLECDGSANTGDGWNIANSLNMFLGDNADADGGVGYHFVSGGSNNTGSLDPDSGGAITFDAGANDNLLFAVAATGPTDNGTGNTVFNVLTPAWMTATANWFSGDRDFTAVFNSGNGGGVRGANFNFKDNGTNKWSLGKTTANTFAIADLVGALTRLQMVTGAQTDIEAGGTTAVRFNNTALAATSTGGVEFYSGGAGSAKTAFILGTGYANLGPVTVGALPAAAAGNKGNMITVSDSTAVAAEGQTCVGGSANTALAFSNGVVWKCF